MKKTFLNKTLLTCAMLAGSSLSTQLYAQNANQPAQVEADAMEYKKEQSKVIATGNVVVTQGERVLNADKVTYNQSTRIVDATGNVVLKEADGSVFYAEEGQVRDDLVTGEVKEVFGTMSGEEAFFEADLVVKESETLMHFEDMEYTTCRLPIIDGQEPEGDPIWELEARKVKVDQEKQTVYYRDAWVEIYDIPVLYTPYFSHPTPNADRKSGLLTPEWSTGGRFGASVATPYYWNIAHNMDATIKPTFTTDEGVLLETEFRHLLENGSYRFLVSGANPRERNNAGVVSLDGREHRGHIEGKGDFTHGDKWVSGFDLKVASDDTYARRFGYGGYDLFTNTAHANYFNGRQYVGIEAVAFQGLNASDDQDRTPFVLPTINAHLERDGGYKNSILSLDVNTLSLYRIEGARTQRVSTTVEWALPHVTSNGHQFELSARARGDLYYLDNATDPSTSTLEDDTATRFIPEVQASWRYPLVNYTKSGSITVEPVVDAIAAPNGGNPDLISNEDSLSQELNDLNVFASNRFTGYDIVETGTRFNYGLQTTYHHHTGALASLMLGQTYRLDGEEVFAVASGLDDNVSDYVGRIELDSGEMVNATYRFRNDKDGLRFNRHEVTTTIDANPFVLSGNYSYFRDEVNGTNSIENLYGRASYQVTPELLVTAYGSRDVDASQWLRNGVQFNYDDKCGQNCFGFEFIAERDYTSDRDIEPETVFMFRIILKGLGEI